MFSNYIKNTEGTTNELFDRKEEVLEIELTSYGRHLLSKGQFKPAYYAFYDDDVVYDSAYIGYSEAQKIQKIG